MNQSHIFNKGPLKKKKTVTNIPFNIVNKKNVTRIVN